MQKLFSFFLFLSLVSAALVPSSVLLAACDCWCATDSGAERMSGQVEDASACKGVCDNYAGCFESGKTPASNGTCWTQYECENTYIERDGEDIPYTWGGQLPTCLAGEGYCYAPTTPIDLMIGIGSVEQVEGIGDYVNAIIQFGIVAGSLFAVVSLMIAGVTWMLARGNSGKVGEAKSRLKKAVTGLIILLTMVAMAEIVSPDLVSFDRLRTPAVKQVTFIDPGTTCEALEEVGFGIAALTGKTCGHSGIIKSVPDGIVANVELGDSCSFIGCEDDLEVCINSTAAGSGEETHECVRCKDAFEISGVAVNAGVDPSSSMCGRLLDGDYELASGQKLYCEFFDAGILNPVEHQACAEIVYPAFENSLDCHLLKELAKDWGSESCRIYDQVYTRYQDILYAQLDDRADADGEYTLLEAVCSPNDPCGLAPPGESCTTFVIDETEDCDVLEGTGAYATCVAGAALGSFANCSNESSTLGMENCLDKDGGAAECNYTLW